MKNLKELQVAAEGLSVLYTEDNNVLRNNAAKLLRKFFTTVDVAADGEIALSMFKKATYDIVISDIKMPNMDGLTLLKHTKAIRPQTKSIIMSAFDDKEILLQGIELSVFRFLKKPVNISELTDVLHEAVLAIQKEQDTQIFYTQLKNIFNYQSAIVAMVHNAKVVLANENFLNFFQIETLEEFQTQVGDLSSQFLEHDGFLYNTQEIDALQSIVEQESKLYHVKMKNSENEMRHFILKYQTIPQKENYGVLSFDDVTELNLLELFDKKKSNADKFETDEKALFELLEVIHRNSAKIELHNYYKGLSITNSGVVTQVSNKSVTIKTTYMQQKAIQIAQKLLIVSSALPFAVESTKIEKISFENQTVEFSHIRFVKTSPVTRETIRVVPKEKHSVSLFLRESKFHGDMKIEDISISAVRISSDALPAGLDEESEVILDMVLELDKKPLIINTKAILFRKEEHKHSFSLVFFFKDLKKSTLVKYITKRQMELIREIKGIQNG